LRDGRGGFGALRGAFAGLRAGAMRRGYHGASHRRHTPKRTRPTIPCTMPLDCDSH
jgi:hypothetical protein